MEEPTVGRNFVDFSKVRDNRRTLIVQLRESVVLENESWGQRRTREVRQD